MHLLNNNPLLEISKNREFNADKFEEINFCKNK